MTHKLSFTSRIYPPLQFYRQLADLSLEGFIDVVPLSLVGLRMPLNPFKYLSIDNGRLAYETIYC